MVMAKPKTQQSYITNFNQLIYRKQKQKTEGISKMVAKAHNSASRVHTLHGAFG